MSSNEEKAVMGTEVSPVVSTSSSDPLSSPEEDKCLLTPLSLDFDPLSWKLEDKNVCNNSSPEQSSPLIDVSVNCKDLMSDSYDLLTMDDNYDQNTNQINGDKCEFNAQLIKEFEPTLNCELESNGWPSQQNYLINLNAVNQNDSETDLTTDSLVSNETNGLEKQSSNECQIASVSQSNTFSEESTNQSISLMSEPSDQSSEQNEQIVDRSVDRSSPLNVESAHVIASKLVNECVSDALHEKALHLQKDQTLNSSSSLSDSSLSDHISSDSDESVQSVSSASSGSTRKKKKNNNRKKASKGQSSSPKVQSSAAHELNWQQIATTDAKTNSIEANNKSVDNLADNPILCTKPELNGHTTNGELMNELNDEMNCLPAINGFHKQNNNKLNDIDVEPSLNGHKKHYDFDNDSLNESTFATEPDYCVNVAKLCSTYTKSDENERNVSHKGVIITGINIKTLKSQYVSHIKNESQILKSFPKEIANTGIDLKSLKNSFVSPIDKNVVNKNAVNKQLLPIAVNINSIKSTFNSEHDMSEDKTKDPKKSAQVNKDVESVCKVCAKHVYQMEKIKAEKSVFHKQCFRCKECNKQLNVDSYSSHEGELYCMPHFKQLFQPKAVFDSEDNQQTNSKVEDQFDNLTLNLANIRNRFETGLEDRQNSESPNVDKSTLQRSESIHIRMQKYQSAVSGEKEGNVSNDEEINEPKDTETEKVVFSGLSSLKSQWETGSIASNTEEAERTKEELENLRKNLSLGRSESLKQVYERAVKESHTEASSGGNRSDAIVLDTSIKTNSIKEKFETGKLESETEEQRIERLKREREEEIQAIAESDTSAKEARNKFKQIDASATKGHTPQQNGHSNGQTNGFVKKFGNGDVVKSGGPISDDVSIDAAQLQQRFSYFENLPKEVPKEPKRHTITPPRDVVQVFENNVEENPNVIKCSDVIEDIPKVDTAKKMLDKFKALENQKDNQSNGPKPLKRITPPRDSTDNTNKKEITPERDPNIIRSSLKSEDDIPVEPEKARNLKAKFENWSAEIDRQNSKNNGYDDEEEYIPHIDTTKNLRKKFETAFQEEVRPVDKPKVRVNRFVCETSGDNNSSDVCYVCRTKLYPMEKLEFSGIRLHKNCFRCVKCKCNLRLDNFTITAEKLYCIPHFKQLFMERGNYDEGFGLEQHKDKWNNKCINNNDLIVNNNNNSSELICDENANDSHIDYSNQSVSDVSDNDF